MSQPENDLFLSSGFLQKINFFKDFSAELINQLLEDHKIVSTGNKQTVFNQDDQADHFGFVIQGTYSLSKINFSKQRTILDFVSVGGMVGGLLMSLAGGIYPITVKSIGPGQFLMISKSVYKKYWMQNAAVMQNVQLANIERVQSLQAMRETQRFSLEQKIAWVLLKILSNSKDEEIPFEINVSRRDLSDAAGVSTESTIRTLSQWTQQGLIKCIGSDEYFNLQLVRKKCFSSDVTERAIKPFLKVK